MMTKDDRESLDRVISTLRSVFAYRGQFERDLGSYQLEKLRLAKGELDRLVGELEAEHAESR